MEILIINLPRYQNFSVTREGRCEIVSNNRVDTPAMLLIIASILRDLDHDIDFIDANGLNLHYNSIIKQLNNKKYDCAIFTFNSSIIDHELQICEVIKNQIPSCLTIGYSWYGLRFGKEIMEEFSNLDIMIIDDPFSVIKKLISSLSNEGDITKVGGIVYRNEKEIIQNAELDQKIKFKDLPIPAYDLLTSFNHNYIFSPLLRPYALVYAGKGCPFRCNYCPVANTKYGGRSAETIVEELKLLKKVGNIRYVWFYDEIFTINRKRVIEVCKKIMEEKLNIKWFCDSRVELVDLELLKWMKKAGCIGISYGVESGSQKILDSMNKGNTVKQAINALKLTRIVGIPIQLNLLLGYDGESIDTLEETRSFVKQVIPEILQITRVFPMHGTNFTKLAFENNWIKSDTSWKKLLTEQDTLLENYEPFNLNLENEFQKIRKILYFNPKWYLICLKTLLMNYHLIIPLFGIFVHKIKQKILNFCKS